MKQTLKVVIDGHAHFIEFTNEELAAIGRGEKEPIEVAREKIEQVMFTAKARQN